MSETIHYRRQGRKLRASGTVVATDKLTGLKKVKPVRPGWKHVFVSDEEIAAGSEKPDYQPKQSPPEPRIKSATEIRLRKRLDEEVKLADKLAKALIATKMKANFHEIDRDEAIEAWRTRTNKHYAKRTIESHA